MDIRVGLSVRGSPGLVINRPQGPGDYAFVRFLGPAAIGEREQLVFAGDCFLWSPRTPMHICGRTTIFNDYVHISTDVAEAALSRFRVPTDALLHPVSVGFVRPLLARVQREWVRRDAHWERAVEMGVEELMLHLSRETNGRSLGHVSPHDDRLRDIRLQVHRAPADNWTVTRMAGLAYLKESQFTALYRRLFGQPPMADVVQVRLELACYYLAQLDIPITEVGQLSGFGDPTYFSRAFRSRHGCSPRTYRRRRRAELS